MHAMTPAVLAGILALPLTAVADTVWSFATYAGTDCLSNQVDFVDIGTQSGSCSPITPPRKDKRETYDEHCVSLAGIQSYEAVPAADTQYNTLYFQGYTTADCSGTPATFGSVVDPESQCFAMGNPDVVAINVFASVCGDPLRV